MMGLGGPGMRTNIVLDEDLVREALELTGIKTKRELVRKALEFLIETYRRKNLLELEGKIQFAPGFDYKALREGKA
jgi:Arc/MetJ family transcription regulator